MRRHLSISNPYFVLGVLALLGSLVYGRVLNYQLCSDDMMFISANNLVKHLDLGEIWRSFNTRFLVGLSFALNYHFAKLDPPGYHVVNIVFHILNSFLVYILVRLTLKTPQAHRGLKDFPALGLPAAGTVLPPYPGPLLAFCSALLFLLHPIQTESVAYISQRLTLMATFFYLGTIIFYLQARLSGRPGFFLGAFFSMLLAIFCKEMTITIPVMLLVYEFFFFEWRKESWKERGLRLLPFILLAAVLLAVFNMEVENSLLNLKTQVSKGFSWEYFFTEINVLRTYLRLLILPLNQNHSYDYPIVPDLFNLPTILSLGLLLSLFCVAIWLFSRRRLLSFAMIWFFITTSVEAGQVCFVHLGVIYEHWLYLPMVGFSLFLPVLLYEFFRDERKIKIAVAVLACVLGLLSFDRNKVWESEFTLWQDVVQKTPTSFIAYNHLSIWFYDHRHYDAAIAMSLKALETCTASGNCLPAQRSRILVTMSGAYFESGDYQNSMAYAIKSLEDDPTNPKAYNNIAAIYYKLGNYKEAIAYFERVIQLDRFYSLAYVNLGITYRQAGDIQTAVNFFQKALQINPDDQSALQELDYTLREVARFLESQKQSVK